MHDEIFAISFVVVLHSFRCLTFVSRAHFLPVSLSLFCFSFGLNRININQQNVSIHIMLAFVVVVRGNFVFGVFFGHFVFCFLNEASNMAHSHSIFTHVQYVSLSICLSFVP